MQHDMLKLDPIRCRFGQHANDLPRDIIRRAPNAEGIRVRLGQEVDRAPGLEQVRIVMEVRPDARFRASALQDLAHPRSDPDGSNSIGEYS